MNRRLRASTAGNATLEGQTEGKSHLLQFSLAAITFKYLGSLE
jgi:hypothetical protein